MISRALLALFATLISSANATLRSSYDYWGLNFLSPSVQALCLTNVTANNIDSDTCADVALCILEHSSEYAKAGFASGTTLLTLIPTALTLIPTYAPGVEEAMSIGWIFAFLAAFSGYITAGKGSNELAKEIQIMRVKRLGGIVHIEGQKRNEASELVPLVRGLLRWLLYILVFAGMGIVLYLSVKLGLETVVTWACNHEFLHVGWLFTRMFPYISEMILLRLFRGWLYRNPDAMSKWEGSDISTAWLMAKAISGLSLMLIGLVVIYGTSLFGSTNLIDGSVVIWEYLLLFPLLFCSMQTVLGACALRTEATHNESSTELISQTG